MKVRIVLCPDRVEALAAGEVPAAADLEEVLAEAPVEAALAADAREALEVLPAEDFMAVPFLAAAFTDRADIITAAVAAWAAWQA